MDDRARWLTHEITAQLMEALPCAHTIPHPYSLKLLCNSSTSSEHTM